ncbi:MAG: amidohydrolase family protein [Candidatus Omnitrophica bacterium]|nr:amidohydrolase family protein [Candidatus Omnitrophota bacterium]
MIVYDFHVHLGKSRDGGSLTAAELGHQMRKSAIRRAVVFAVDELDIGLTFEPQNRKIIQLAERNPAIIPFCRLNPRNRSAALIELRRCYRSGFKGLKLHPRSEKIAYNSIDFLLEEVSGYGWPVIMHSSHEKNCMPALWEKTFKRFNKISFILAHGGKDSYQEAIDVARRRKNVFLETSTLSFNRTQVILRQLGPRRIVFASDAPYSHMLIERKKYELLCGKRDLQYIFEKNARRILNLAAAPYA